MLLNVAIGRHLEPISLEPFRDDCMQGMQENCLTEVPRLLPKFEEGPCFSSQSLILLIAHTRDQISHEISPEYLATSIPRTDCWHRGQLAKNRLHQHYLPFKLHNRLITSKVPTRNGALPAPELSTGQNLCQQLF